jgi:hypothetical protein
VALGVANEACFFGPGQQGAGRGLHLPTLQIWPIPNNYFRSPANCPLTQ